MLDGSSLVTILASTVLSGGFATAVVTWLNGRNTAKVENAKQRTENVELSFSRLERENARQATRILELETKLAAAEAREDQQREEVRKLKDRLDELQRTLRQAQAESAELREEVQKLMGPS